MHFIYIIHSANLSRYYVGETINVEGRIGQHNQSHYESASTRFSQDWQLKLVFQTVTKSEALIVEKYIKSMKSKRFIEKLINDESFLSGFKKVIKDKHDIII